MSTLKTDRWKLRAQDGCRFQSFRIRKRRRFEGCFGIAIDSRASELCGLALEDVKSPFLVELGG